MSEVTAVLWAVTSVLWLVLAIVSFALLMVTDAEVKYVCLFPFFFCACLIQMEFRSFDAVGYAFVGVVQAFCLIRLRVSYLDVCEKRWGHGDDEEDFEDEGDSPSLYEEDE